MKRWKNLQRNGIIEHIKSDKSAFGGNKVSIFTKIAEKYDWKIIGENAVLANNKLQMEIVSRSNENDNLKIAVKWYRNFLYQLGLTDLFENFKQWRDRILDSLHELAMKAVKQDYEEYCGYDNDYNDESIDML